MTWEPAQYLKYSNERLRPALDLMARIVQTAPRSVVDLGCGAGNVTRILAERWPSARVTGVDNSAAMLTKAREAVPAALGIEWQTADLAAWAAGATPASVDLVYSNAALHWLSDHATLFPALMRIVARDGVLAVQMPSNFLAPSHVVLEEVVGNPRWNSRLGALRRGVPVAPPAQYFEWLLPQAQSVDVWTTEYLHVLSPDPGGDHPVIAWMKGTALTPFFAVLDANAQRELTDDCTGRITEAYPSLPDGRVLYPFRRLFMVAARGNR
jgi:trans-aconitate 2-methyltransferase